LVGCTTVGQTEDDVRIAQQFKPLGEEQIALIRDKGSKLKGPQLEDWKINTETGAAGPHRDVYYG
jgi:hypothetical protein